MRELQEKGTATTNKVEVKKSKGKRLSKSKQKKSTKQGKKKTKPPSIKIAKKGTSPILNSTVDTFCYDDCLVIKNQGVLASDGIPTYSGTKRKRIARKKVVLTSFEDDDHIISSTQASP